MRFCSINNFMFSLASLAAIKPIAIVAATLLNETSSVIAHDSVTTTTNTFLPISTTASTTTSTITTIPVTTTTILNSVEPSSITVNDNFSMGGIGDYFFWLSANGVGNNTATFKSDGSFNCTFDRAYDFVCGNSRRFEYTTDPNVHLYVDFEIGDIKFQNITSAFFNFSTSRNLTSFCIVENWITSENLQDKHSRKISDYFMDGSYYTIYEGKMSDSYQYYSYRQEPRFKGTIDSTAHIQLFDQLGLIPAIQQFYTLPRNLSFNIVAYIQGIKDYNGQGTIDIPVARIYSKIIENDPITVTSNISLPTSTTTSIITQTITSTITQTTTSTTTQTTTSTTTAIPFTTTTALNSAEPSSITVNDGGQ